LNAGATIELIYRDQLIYRDPIKDDYPRALLHVRQGAFFPKGAFCSPLTAARAPQIIGNKYESYMMMLIDGKKPV